MKEQSLECKCHKGEDVDCSCHPAGCPCSFSLDERFDNKFCWVSLLEDNGKGLQKGSKQAQEIKKFIKSEVARALDAVVPTHPHKYDWLPFGLKKHNILLKAKGFKTTKNV